MRRSQATIFVPILLSVLAGGCGLGGPPSDAVMIAQLQRERAAFDAIVRMMEEDRIEGELVVNPLRADSAAQRVRREQYRDLVRRTGCERVQRDPVTRRVTFVRRYLTAGGGVAGTGFKDYVYAPAPPAPLRATLDPDDGTRFEDTFRHVDGPWYLCRMRI